MLLLRFTRGHQLMFLSEFHTSVSRYKEMRVHCSCYKQHPRFSPPFWAPLAQGAKILTHVIWILEASALITTSPRKEERKKERKKKIWVLSTCACKILSRIVKVCWSYMRNADFEQLLTNWSNLHRESKKSATLTMAITLSILDRFAKFFHCCKQQ